MTDDVEGGRAESEGGHRRGERSQLTKPRGRSGVRLRPLNNIQRYLTDVDQAAFLANEEKQDAVIRNLEIIGEAAGKIQRHFPGFVTQYPDFPLKAAYGTRNVLS